MIIKGNARADAKSLAAHLLRADTNERVEVVELRGVVAEDLLGALKEIDAVSCCTNTKKPFYHASINTPIEERLTPEQRQIAIDRLEAALGLEGQPRAVVVHEKKDREHCHIVWSRTDLENSRAIRMDHNYRTHEEVSRALEREFGHGRVQGAHIERGDTPRPKRTPGHDEMQQSARSGWRPQEAASFVTGLWNRTDSGKAFEAALAEEGWLLARGDRRDFVLVDPLGGTHSLARRVYGRTAADVRERMADLANVPMPSVSEARAKVLQVAALEVWLERRPSAGGTDPDWTDRGGMVAQQRSAIAWVNSVRRAQDIVSPKDAPLPPTPAEPTKKEDGLSYFKDLHPDKGYDRDR